MGDLDAGPPRTRHERVIIGITRSGLDPTTRHVLRALEDFADDGTGVAYPSVATLARATGYGTTAVGEAIGRALAAGWLTHTGTSHHRTVRYAITPPVAPATPPQPQPGQFADRTFPWDPDWDGNDTY